jgi:hypothetical protein
MMVIEMSERELSRLRVLIDLSDKHAGSSDFAPRWKFHPGKYSSLRSVREDTEP